MEEVKRRELNLSDLCNQLLEAYLFKLSGEEDPQYQQLLVQARNLRKQAEEVLARAQEEAGKLRVAAWQKEKEAKERLAKAVLEQQLEEFRKYFQRKEKEGWTGLRYSREEWIQRAAARFGVSPQKMLELLQQEPEEGRKKHAKSK